MFPHVLPTDGDGDGDGDMDVLTTGTGQQRNVISFQFIIIDRPVFSVVFPVFCALSTATQLVLASTGLSGRQTDESGR